MTAGAGGAAASGGDDAAPAARSRGLVIALIACAALAFAGLLALGTWQLQRLQWKLDLIARVEQRVQATPVAAPGAQRWPAMTAASDEYRHVSLNGTYLHENAVRVQAVTELGGGFWLMTPLKLADGSIVLINRGFVTAGYKDNHPTAVAANVTGLLRMSEPGGGFLRNNDPAANRWYSRDVGAIAAASGLRDVAPYFVDADAATGASDEPVGGLTVVAFQNNHLVYALTWYVLAAMVAGAGVWLARRQ